MKMAKVKGNRKYQGISSKQRISTNAVIVEIRSEKCYSFILVTLNN